jgi:TonB family protein
MALLVQKKQESPAGKSARVILSIEVRAGGTTGWVAVETSSGSELTDRVAVEYAKSLRWHPANIRGTPLTIRISMPVVFNGQ